MIMKTIRIKESFNAPVDQFRATMSAALLVMGLVRFLGYFAIGEYTGDCGCYWQLRFR
jgi:hypothetical protein